MEKKGKKPWKKLGPVRSYLTATKKKFQAPTKGYEDFFTSVTAKDAAQFVDTIDQLSMYVATLDWKQASALAKVMTNLKDPTLVSPARPTKNVFERIGTRRVRDKRLDHPGHGEHPDGRQHRLSGYHE